MPTRPDTSPNLLLEIISEVMDRSLCTIELPALEFQDPIVIEDKDINSLRFRRESIVARHVAAENQHDVEATIATFHHPRYEVNGKHSDGADAVRGLLQDLMNGFPDLHVEPVRLQHLDDGVLVEGNIGGTHEGEWGGVPPTGRTFNASIIAIFDFDADRLICEKVYYNVASVLTQLGVLADNG